MGGGASKRAKAKKAEEAAAVKADVPHFADLGMRVPSLLLPRADVDPTKWCVIACDQYTSKPQYWKEVKDIVGDAPSTLKLIFPEVYLGEGRDKEILEGISKSMKEYDESGIMQPNPPGFVLLNRKTPVVESRLGLLVELDLDQYSFEKGSQSLIRATEATIEDRLPPRIAIRERASVELPHILVLIDDPEMSVIEPLAKNKANYKKLYDFEMMQGAGHIEGYQVDTPEAIDGVAKALRSLADPSRFRKAYGAKDEQGVLLFAVGDGNHSLATAKRCWEQLKKKGAKDDHPARFALVELNNVHDPGLQFEPIHRLVFGVTPQEFVEDAQAFFAKQGLTVELRPDTRLSDATDCHELEFRAAGYYAVLAIKGAPFVLAAATLTSWLDPYLAAHSESSVDYVHGTEIIDERCAGDAKTVGILLPTFNKNDLLRTVVQEGVLPRKTFSMGEADEKRFYFEARRILPAGSAVLWSPAGRLAGMFLRALSAVLGFLRP
eukprot:CAMPEP_0170625990 /NCGR_PEP_ID=MMETSP0224-20130122/31091_1 /TAXON_ID=285029 /ORGANISM="Togula jolla, Strain CCCM 725" /LENGTH=492 /DNA_ID=CAMNT_0010952677 /DNA_START=1 /DNA_END=1477 /DNA_ORIENTATION=+